MIDKEASGATAVDGNILRALHKSRFKPGQGSMNVRSVVGVWHPYQKDFELKPSKLQN